jgi:DNA polymerase-3 subunit beta
LQDILRSLPDSAEVSLNLEEKRLQVKAGKSRFNLQTLPAEDFPRMALADGEIHKIT